VGRLVGVPFDVVLLLDVCLLDQDVTDDLVLAWRLTHRVLPSWWMPWWPLLKSIDPAAPPRR
jgi:hypothetical protein